MIGRWNRRDLVRAATATAGALGWRGTAGATPSRRARPLVIASSNGLAAGATAMRSMQAGADPLDAVLAGVNLVELDPLDTSVGYGGLPNEDGVVELDASVMHGPSGRGGGVAALQGVKTPSLVARLVAFRTPHVLLVGEGARRFATAHGFADEDLLTDAARQAWLHWRENLSERDGWLSPQSAQQVAGEGFEAFVRHHGTINCNALDAAGNIAGVTTTSGLAFKLAGRVGDSPILGAGLYVDNDVGACGSTGLGEANLLGCCSFLVVELMRNGTPPRDAAVEALRRVAARTRAPHLLTSAGRPNFNLEFYCLNRAGEYAGASMYGQGGAGPRRFAVNDGGESRLEDCAALFDLMEP